MNYWYSARPRELFLDLDSNRATSRALSVIRADLLKDGRLGIQRVFIYRTQSVDHAHMVLKLGHALTPIQRVGWGLWMGSDKLRAAFTLARLQKTYGLQHVDLLVGDERYHRKPDATCECTNTKHKVKEVTDACPAMKQLMAGWRSLDYYTRVGGPTPKRKIRVPWGEVDLEQIKEWRDIWTNTRKRK